MPKKRNDVVSIEENADERISTEATSSPSDDKPRKKRTGVYIPLNEFGQLDSARIRDTNREGIEQARVALGVSSGASTGAVEGTAGIVTEDHVKTMLKYYGYLPVSVIPPMINSRLRDAGRPEISDTLALQTYMLSDKQIESMSPDGAQFLNQLIEGLPQWIKDLLFSFGPGAKFLGQLAIITAMQTKAMLDAYKIQNPTEQPVNGAEAKPN